MPPFRVREQRGMDRMQRHLMVGEPLSHITHLVAVGVIKVLTRREQFNTLEARAKNPVQCVRAEPLINKKIG